jgi:hypothetical protein
MQRSVTFPKTSAAAAALQTNPRKLDRSALQNGSGAHDQHEPFGRLGRVGTRFDELRGGPVSARELQGAVLLVLALYASMALLNLGAELNALAEHWQAFVDFLATGLLS